MNHDEHKDSEQQRLGQGLEDWLRAAPSDEDSLDELFDLLDGRLSSEAESSLRRRIAQDPRLAQQWQQVQEDVGEWASGPSSRETSTPAPNRISMAVAAGVVIGAIALAWFGLRPESPRPGASTTGAETLDVVADRKTENEFDALAELERLRTVGSFVLPSQLDDLRPSAGMLRDADPATPSDAIRPQPIAPVGTFTLDAPKLRWRPVPGAVHYDIVVTTLSFDEVAAVQGLGEDTSWQPDTSSWPRGTLLTWQVTANLGDGRAIRAPVPPAAEARFALLESAAAAEVAGHLQQVALAFEEGVITSNTRRLLQAKIFANAGLVELAEVELEGLVSPSDEALIERLRSSLEVSPDTRRAP